MSKLRDVFDEAVSEQIEGYAQRSNVMGLANVARGERVLYPTTIYNVEGDETSGVAGMLMADGEFRSTAAPLKTQRYWNSDETLHYEKVDGELNEAGTGPRVVGNSWCEGEVFWDGSVAGEINHSALAGDETDLLRQVVSRRVVDSSLCGEWATTGELYKAMERGTSMQGGRVPGKIHGSADTDNYYKAA